MRSALPRHVRPSRTLACTTIEGLAVMSITASEARKELFPLIKKVNEDHDAIEIVSRHGNAGLVSAEDYAALREGAYLLRSPANARRLLKAYENALNGIHLAEHALIDPGAAGPPERLGRRGFDDHGWGVHPFVPNDDPNIRR